MPIYQYIYRRAELKHVDKRLRDNVLEQFSIIK